MADPIMGAGGRLSGVAFGRGVSLLFSKVARINKIDQTLKGKEVDPIIKAALSDYETHLAATHGQYTVDVEAFHNELMRSGVLDAMAELAIVGRHSDSTTAIFKSIYLNFFPSSTEDAAEELYVRMETAFRSSIAALSKDPATIKFMHAFHKQINHRLDQIESAGLQKAGNGLTPEQLFATIASIAKGLQNHYKTLKVETLNGARQVNISDIYVAPSLMLVTNDKAAQSITNLVSVAKEQTYYRESLSRMIRVVDKDPLNQFSYSELKGAFRRIVILGDPGGGKSTICQRLCFDMARATSLALSYQGKNHVASGEQRVPFRIILRLYEQARLSNPQLDIFTYLVNDLRHYTSASVQEIEAAVRYLLTTGRAVIAFDGLDEILETANRRDYAELVSSFCNSYPLCPSVVTSRLVGYDNAPLPSDFDKVILQRFSPEEVDDYAKRFFIHIGEMDPKVAESEAGRFMSQTIENASDIRCNPLMLGLMLWLFMAKGDVPSNRPAIYSECATLMFDKWDSNRGIRSKIPAGFDRAQLFSSIASKVYEDPKLRAGVSRQWLHDHLVSYFSDKFVDGAKAYEAADSLVTFLVGRAWVMMEAGEGVFSFTHQTFLEYFYAKHLESQFDGVSDLWRNIRSRVSRRERDVVNHLALQTKSFGNDRVQSEAITEILRYVARLTNANSKNAVLGFAAKSLEYLVPSEADVRLIVQAVVKHALDRAIGSKVDFHNVYIAVSSCNLRRKFVTDEVVRLMVQAISGEDDSLARAGIAFLTSAGHSAWSQNAVLAFEPVKSVAQLARPAILEKAQSQRWWAKAAWALYAEVSVESVRRFGLQTYYEAELISQFHALPGVEAVTLASLQNYQGYFVRSNVTPATLNQALRVLGDAGFALMDEAPVPISRRSRNTRFPITIWRAALRQTFDDREAFKGVLLAFTIQNELTPSAKEDADAKRILPIFREFERKNAGWDGLTASVRKALQLERGLVATPHRGRPAAVESPS